MAKTRRGGQAEQKATEVAQPAIESKVEPALPASQSPLGNTRSDFLKALSFIKPGIASGSIIEQSDMVLMDGERLVSYNDEVAVSHPYSIGHQGGVKAIELVKLLQKLPAEEISINESDSEDGKKQLIISCGNVEAGFFIASELSVPELGIDAIEEWHSLPEDFCESILFCLNSAATDAAKGILICVNIKRDLVLSCDNVRATKKQMDAALPDGIELNIPRQSAKDLAGYSPVQFAQDENWVHFRTVEGTVFSVRSMSSDYPPVEGLFEGVEGNIIPLPKDLKQTLSRAEVLAGEDERTKSKFVEIEVIGGKIICSSQGQSGWVTEKVATSYKGEIPKLFVNPAMLAYVLDSVQVATVTDRTLVFKGDRFAHVIALVQKKKKGE